MSPVGHRPPRHPANAIRGVPIDSGRGGEGRGREGCKSTAAGSIMP